MRLSRHRRIFALWFGVLQLLLAGRAFALGHGAVEAEPTVCGPSHIARAAHVRVRRTVPPSPNDRHQQHAEAACHTGTVCCAPVVPATADVLPGVAAPPRARGSICQPIAHHVRRWSRFAHPLAHAPPAATRLAD